MPEDWSCIRETQSKRMTLQTLVSGLLDNFYMAVGQSLGLPVFFPITNKSSLNTIVTLIFLKHGFTQLLFTTTLSLALKTLLHLSPIS